MISYSEQKIFTRRELQAFERAVTFVAIVPHEIDGEIVRCHELARAIGKVLGLEHQDGRYGFVDHTWLWTEPRTSLHIHPWHLPNVLDVYVPGSLPQVQLMHTGSSGLPHRYFISNVFDVVIREDIVEKIVRMLEGDAPKPSVDTRPKLRLDLAGRRMTRCQSDDDGMCDWEHCPQLRDDEPNRSGRHCPLDRRNEDE